MTKLEISEGLLKDHLALRNFLESHYLDRKSFEVVIDKRNLPCVEEVFDEIIRKHGLLQSSFTYVFVGD